VSGSTAKRTSARERIQAKRAAEAAARARADRRRRAVVGGVAAVVVLAVALVIVFVVQSRRTDTSGATPAGAVADGTAFPVGEADAPVTVDLYEDFLCPVCRQFEEVNGATLESLAEEGTVRIQYRPIAILDRASDDEYSTRALNAAAVVFDAAGSEAFAEFHASLFAEQPAEGGPGLSDDRLIELAAEAGATGTEVENGIRDRRFEAWTRRVTDAASQAGVTGTPTVLIDGEPLDLAEATPENITALVEAAAAE
jgi:protein-disulfide isomerase